MTTEELTETNESTNNYMQGRACPHSSWEPRIRHPELSRLWCVSFPRIPTTPNLKGITFWELDNQIPMQGGTKDNDNKLMCKYVCGIDVLSMSLLAFLLIFHPFLLFTFPFLWVYCNSKGLCAWEREKEPEAGNPLASSMACLRMGQILDHVLHPVVWPISSLHSTVATVWLVNLTFLVSCVTNILGL